MHALPVRDFLEQSTLNWAEYLCYSLGFISFFSPTAESFGVSAQIGSGVVRGGPEVRFHEGSTRVPPKFHEGSTRFCEGCGVVRALKRAPHAVGDVT